MSYGVKKNSDFVREIISSLDSGKKLLFSKSLDSKLQDENWLKKHVLNISSYGGKFNEDELARAKYLLYLELFESKYGNNFGN